MASADSTGFGANFDLLNDDFGSLRESLEATPAWDAIEADIERAEETFDAAKAWLTARVSRPLPSPQLGWDYTPEAYRVARFIAGCDLEIAQHFEDTCGGDPLATFEFLWRSRHGDKPPGLGDAEILALFVMFFVFEAVRELAEIARAGRLNLKTWRAALDDLREAQGWLIMLQNLEASPAALPDVREAGRRGGRKAKRPAALEAFIRQIRAEAPTATLKEAWKFAQRRIEAAGAAGYDLEGVTLRWEEDRLVAYQGAKRIGRPVGFAGFEKIINLTLG